MSSISAAETPRGHAVTPGQFERLASKGHSILSSRGPQETTGLTGKAVSHHAFKSTRQNWGGETIHPATGKAINPSKGYAVSIKTEGQSSVEIPAGSRHAEFHQAMAKARHEFAPQLSKSGSYLGVFRQNNTIQMDPVTIASTGREADAIGAASHSTGGAYNFGTGNGRYAPHVRNKH